MCVICETYEKYGDYKMLSHQWVICCANCPTLTAIPNIPTLTTIFIENCPLVRMIPSTLVELTQLTISNCPLITNIPASLTGIVDLHIDKCPLITDIPASLTKLNELYVDNCPLITDIPASLTLITCLTVSNCPLLTYIPASLASITQLIISKCPILTSIPDHKIPMIIKDQCSWLYLGKEYKDNVSKLIVIQRHYFRRKVNAVKQILLGVDILYADIVNIISEY